MPPNSTDRFLTAPVRAVRSFRRYLYSASCQEPARRLLGLLGLPRPPGPFGISRILGLLGLLGPLKPSGPQGSLRQLG